MVDELFQSINSLVWSKWILWTIRLLNESHQHLNKYVPIHQGSRKTSRTCSDANSIPLSVCLLLNSVDSIEGFPARSAVRHISAWGTGHSAVPEVSICCGSLGTYSLAKLQKRIFRSRKAWTNTDNANWQKFTRTHLVARVLQVWLRSCVWKDHNQLVYRFVRRSSLPLRRWTDRRCRTDHRWAQPTAHDGVSEWYPEESRRCFDVVRPLNTEQTVRRVPSRTTEKQVPWTVSSSG